MTGNLVETSEPRDATGSHAESCGAVVDSDVSRCASSMLRVLVFDSSSKLLLAAATVILIRVMSPIEYARYTISYAYAMVLTQLIAGSFNRVYLVGYKSLGLERQLGEFLSLQLLTIIVAAPLLLLLSPTRSIGIAAAALLLSLCLGEFARSTFQRALRFTAFSLLEFGRAVLTVLGIATIAWFLGEGLRASQVLLVQSGVSVLLFGMSMRLRLLVRLPHWQVVHAIGSDLARSQYRSLFAYFLVQAIFSQVDILVLKMTGTDHQLASYGSAYRYYTFLLLCLTAVNSVLLPLVQSFTTWAEIDEAMRRQRTALGIYGLIVLFLIAVAPALLPLGTRPGREAERPHQGYSVFWPSLRSFRWPSAPT